MSAWPRWTGLGFAARPRALLSTLAAAERARRQAASQAPAPAPPAACGLTHHQILALVAPFTRRGYRVDMAASERLQRRLLFMPVAHDDERFPGLQETLQLHSPRNGYYRLQRSLQRPGGPAARLLAEGAQPAELLDRVQAVPATQHFEAGDGFELARSLRLEPPGTPGSAAPATQLVPTEALVQTEALTLALQISSGHSRSAQAALQTRQGALRPLPDDLLAVLGWHWSLLSPLGASGSACTASSVAAPGSAPRPQVWRCSLRLRGEGSARLADLSRKLHAAGRHLAATLAGPPRSFHEQHKTARWAVLARRSIPLAVSGFMGAHVAFVGPLTVTAWAAAPTGALMLPLLAPAVLGVYLLLGEAPRIEIPSWPRADPAPAWQRPA